jgi:hypothetical protein
VDANKIKRLAWTELVVRAVDGNPKQSFEFVNFMLKDQLEGSE